MGAGLTVTHGSEHSGMVQPPGRVDVRLQSWPGHFDEAGTEVPVGSLFLAANSQGRYWMHSSTPTTATGRAHASRRSAGYPCSSRSFLRIKYAAKLGPEKHRQPG